MRYSIKTLTTMKNLFVLALCFIGYVAGAQNTLAHYTAPDKTGYESVDYLEYLSKNKYSTSYLARRGNDVVFVIESVREITYAKVMYITSTDILSADETWAMPADSDAYYQSYDATTGKYTLLVTLGDYREIEPTSDHYVFRVRSLIQYNNKAKDHTLHFVVQK